MNRTRMILFSYFLLGCCIYAASLQNPFIYDDFPLIAQNQWLHFEQIPHFFRSFIPDSSLAFVGYRPLVLSSFVIENELWGKTPWIFRFDNLLLHVVLSFLVFLFARLWFSKRLSFWIGLLFLHPVQSNVITLVWKRTDLLVGIGILGALYFYTQSVINMKTRSVWIGHLFAIIGILSKENALILLPCVVLFHFLIWKPKQPSKKLLASIYIPLVLLFVGHTWVLFVKQPAVVRAFYFETQSYLPASTLFEFNTYLRTQALCFWKYVALAFFPVHLQVFHTIDPIRTPLDPAFLFSILGLVGLIFTTAFYRKKHPLLLFCLVWALLLFAPTSLTPLHLAFDEDRLCLPLFPIILFVFLIFQHLASKISIRQSHAYILGTGLILLFSLGSFFRSLEWKDEIKLWHSNIAEAPQDPRPWGALSQAWAARKNYELASQTIGKSVSLDPTYGMGFYLWAQNLYALGKEKEALDKLTTALRIDGLKLNYLSLLSEMSQKKNTDLAFQAIWLSLQLQPNSSRYLNQLSIFLETVHEVRPSYRAARQAFLQNPMDVATQLQLASLLWKYEHKPQDALEILETILKNEPHNSQALQLKQKIEERLD